jgi:hypothetical protein
MKSLRENQKQILEMKKQAKKHNRDEEQLRGVISQLSAAEQGISEHQGWSIKITQTEIQRGKRGREM